MMYPDPCLTYDITPKSDESGYDAFMSDKYSEDTMGTNAIDTDTRDFETTKSRILFELSGAMFEDTSRKMGMSLTFETGILPAR